MRKISSKIFWRDLAPVKLSKKEFAEYKKQADEGISNKEDTIKSKDFYCRYGKMTAKVIDCHRPRNFMESGLAIWEMSCSFSSQFEERGIKDFSTVSDENCRKIARKMGAIGASFARKRKCHFLRNGVVCYCDENSNEEKG